MLNLNEGDDDYDDYIATICHDIELYHITCICHRKQLGRILFNCSDLVGVNASSTWSFPYMP